MSKYRVKLAIYPPKGAIVCLCIPSILQVFSSSHPPNIYRLKTPSKASARLKTHPNPSIFVRILSMFLSPPSSWQRWDPHHDPLGSRGSRGSPHLKKQWVYFRGRDSPKNQQNDDVYIHIVMMSKYIYIYIHMCVYNTYILLDIQIYTLIIYYVKTIIIQNAFDVSVTKFGCNYSTKIS